MAEILIFCFVFTIRFDDVMVYFVPFESGEFGQQLYFLDKRLGATVRFASMPRLLSNYHNYCNLSRKNIIIKSEVFTAIYFRLIKIEII